MVIQVIPIRGGSAASLKKLRELIQSVKNPRKANKDVSVWLLRWVNNNFKSQGGNVGGWKPFKHGGRKMPGGAINTSAKLLQDIGHLRASFNHNYGRRFAEVGSDIRYSITHELGRPSVNLPARRMLPLASDKAVERGIIRIYNTWIKREIRK